MKANSCKNTIKNKQNDQSKKKYKKNSVTGNRTRVKRTTILHDNHYTMTDLQNWPFVLNNFIIKDKKTQ